MYTDLDVRHALFLSDFNETWILWADIKFNEILVMETELFHADRKTDMTKLIVVFLNFPN